MQATQMRLSELAHAFNSGERAPPEGVTPEAAALVVSVACDRMDTVAAMHAARAQVFMGLHAAQRTVMSAILALPECENERPAGCRSTSTTESDDGDEDDDDKEGAEDVAEDDDDGDALDDDDAFDDAIEGVRSDIADLSHSFSVAFAVSQVVAVVSMLTVTAAVFGVWNAQKCACGVTP